VNLNYKEKIMRDIPDAPWVGKCKEDYYRHDEEETVICDGCGERIPESEAYYIDGEAFCEDCHEAYYDEED
jgi:formylmethanofuran dehydrogenase subunit E